MKNLKLIILVVVAIFSFGTAEAQSVVVKVGTGVRAQPPRRRPLPPRRTTVVRYRPAPHGRYYYNGRHYAHRTVYYRNHRRLYRYY